MQAGAEGIAGTTPASAIPGLQPVEGHEVRSTGVDTLTPAFDIKPAERSQRVAPLPVITTQVREPDTKLWALLTKPGPLSTDEWAYIAEQEAAGADPQ